MLLSFLLLLNTVKGEAKKSFTGPMYTRTCSPTYAFQRNVGSHLPTSSERKTG